MKDKLAEAIKLLEMFESLEDMTPHWRSLKGQVTRFLDTHREEKEIERLSQGR